MTQQKKSKSTRRVPRNQSARGHALDILIAIEEQSAYSNLMLNQAFQKLQLEQQDKALVTELVYGTIQRQNTLDHFLTPFVKKGLHKLDRWVHLLLRMSVYQMAYMDRIPAHAVVNESVTIAKQRAHQGISGMVNGVLRSMLRTADAFTVREGQNAIETMSLQHAHPVWMMEQWVKQYGEETAARIAASNQLPPAASLRVNEMKMKRTELIDILQEQGYTVRPSLVHPSGVVVERGGNLAAHPLFQEGCFSIQDESSMVVAEAVAPEPGMTVLDCCAAPGGKSSHMAEKMKDQGQLIANDLHPHKQKLIQQQADRLGLQSIEAKVSDAAQIDQVYESGQFDRILLDAPCSGLGVIRRKPDLKWNKQAEEMAQLPALQLQLLEAAAALLKPDGRLVYSTCTIVEQENEGVVQSFLDKHPEYTWDEQMVERLPESIQTLVQEDAPGRVQILPYHFQSDGFFIASLRRTC
ncbi:16S rRNA (cytosine(967)-C(5))-methyltransferase RsmB [Marinicrinis sediminis]|uniref:16S rRNA (cytosine(967)-C(5))-methyltransferase n=1 Tax=Marinicrinis sediminis TaxID=1652465 RepID=A0ABW5R708_9BACL